MKSFFALLQTLFSLLFLLIGFIAIVFGLVDFVGGRLHWFDLTGVFWSPIAEGLGGGFLIWLGKTLGDFDDD